MPEYRIPVHHEEEEDEQDDDEQGDDNEVPDEDADPSSNRSSNHFSRQDTYETNSARNSATSNNIVIESESYQDSPSAGTHTSPASSPPPVQSTPATGQSDGPVPAPVHLNGSRSRLEIVPLERVSADLNVGNGDLSKQGNEEPSSPSTWEKMVNSFMRTNSGRRSRSNSIAKRELPDTTVNRESENNLAMSKPEPSTPIHQSSSSASASMTSFAPYTPTRGAPSPIPPATSADMHKYQDAKLFPFPGIHMLEQLRAKGPNASASVPDVANLRYSSNDDGTSFATSPSRTPDMTRERKLSHQASDTRLRGKCQFHSSRAYVT